MDLDLALDILADAATDTLVLVPFLLVTYLVLEALERLAGERVDAAIRRAGAAGPVVGAVLGAVPQCGFSAMGATLYAGRVVTLGTLVAVFLSTSDELLPVLVAGGVPAAEVVGIVAAKAAIALVTGLAVDLGLRALRHRPALYGALRRALRGAGAALDEAAEAGEGAEHIHELCEQEGCGCEETELCEHDCACDDAAAAHVAPAVAPASRLAHPRSHAAEHVHTHHHHHATGRAAVLDVVRSAVAHTLKVGAFIFLVTLVLVAALELVGEETLAGLLAGSEVVAVFAAALVGLVPNCAASVVICELWLEGVLATAPMMAGTLVAAGTGLLVLLRTNRHPRENAAIVALLYAVSVVWGLVLVAAGL